MRIDPLARKAAAEFVGTFCFFFIGIGAVVATQMMGVSTSYPGLLGVAFAHGIILAIMVSALGAVSGGHFNPAVTFGIFVGRLIDARQLVVYWCAQLAGAICAALAVKAVFPSLAVQAVHTGAPAVGGISASAGTFLEALLTFFLVLAVYGTAVDPRHPPIGGLGIGLTVFVDILVGGSITGGVMNPARAFGPELVANFWTDWPVYWIGP